MRTVIHGTDMFDAISGSLQRNQTIVMKDKKIAWIGDEGSFEKEDGDQIIDATGKTTVPGLFDCHVHLTGTATNEVYREFMRTNEEVYYYWKLKHAQEHLRSGFTTLRETGSPYTRASTSLRKVLDNHTFYGPRLLIAQGLVQKGNQELIGPTRLIRYDPDELEKVSISGPEDMLRGVRMGKQNGANLIKIPITGGVLHGQESDLGRSLWRDEELEMLVDEAHRLDLHTAAHAHGNVGMYRAVDHGIDTIEHGTLIEENTMDLMIKKGTYLIPTRSAGKALKTPEAYEKMPPEVQKKVDDLQSAVDNFRLAYEKGVNFGLGTDAGTPTNPHGATAKEITSMVEEVGMSTTEALQCATIESAKAIKVDSITGSLEVGKFGDMVVVDGNPLDDIKILEDRTKLLHVIRDGVIMAEKGKIIDHH